MPIKGFQRNKIIQAHMLQLLNLKALKTQTNRNKNNPFIGTSELTQSCLYSLFQFIVNISAFHYRNINGLHNAALRL